MRLIDADALEKDIMSYKTMPEIRKAICEVIDNAPTIIYCNQTSEGLPLMDLRPRPQGKWIEYAFKTCGGLGDWDYKCSNCEKVYGGKYNFCPNCGAKMRKRGIKWS